jgi:hypothetical protein
MEDPVPALGRGVNVLRRLASGPATLEELVRATALPRSSLARQLQSLQLAGCVDRVGQRYHAIAYLMPVCPTEDLDSWRPGLTRLATRGVRAELWAFTVHGPVLVGAVAGPGLEDLTLVGTGFAPETGECMAPVLLWWAARGGAPARPWWWDHTRLVHPPRIDDLLEAARRGVATCPAVNRNGLRRVAVPLRAGDVVRGALAAAVRAPAAADLLRWGARLTALAARPTAP